MEIPKDLQREIDQALDRIDKDPEHHYLPKYRQTLFYISKADPVLLKTWKRLALVTAQHVLPIYEKFIDSSGRTFEYYDVRYPSKAIKLAEAILQGKASKEAGYGTANGAYDQSDFDYRLICQPVPFNVYQASWTANMALLEVSKENIDQFSKLPHVGYYDNGFGSGHNIGERIAQQFPDGIAGIDFTDVLWSQTGHSDTASVASTAWAYDPYSKDVNSDKLHEFWNWWLTDGIQEAWKRTIKTAD